MSSLSASPSLLCPLAMPLLRPLHGIGSHYHRLTAPRRSPLAVRQSRGFSLAVSRSSLPFPSEKANYYKELQAAVDIVERACRLCVDVKRSLLSSEGRILEKNDSTPVTVADFGVQALVSLELGRLFPSIPLVAEEDSGFLRSSSLTTELDGDFSGNELVKSVVSAVVENVSDEAKSLTSDDVLGAIDRGGKDAFVFSKKPATYWVLDPIDGTRGFLKGNDALYVVGLSLVVEGNIVIGVMGCPNWTQDLSCTTSVDIQQTEKRFIDAEPGIIMVAHVGCGTWTRRLPLTLDFVTEDHVDWSKCSVDRCSLVHEAHFCIPDSQTWASLPLSAIFSSKTDVAQSKGSKEVLLLRKCCGSLCKYLMVASGLASVFILRAKVHTLIKAWDHAVGMICVHEAGGQVSDWRGQKLDFGEDQIERRFIFPSGGVLVTNGLLHTQILELISSDLKLV